MRIMDFKKFFANVFVKFFNFSWSEYSPRRKNAQSKSAVQEYANDEIIEVLIKYLVRLPSRVKDFNIDLHPLHVRQDGGQIFINLHKKIPKKLFDDIKKFYVLSSSKKEVPKDLYEKNPAQYILGYIRETLPTINTEIIKRKYSEGHIILRTISQFDIERVFLIDDKGKHYQVLWPLPLPGCLFLPTKELEDIEKNPQKFSVVFVKDLIAAMTNYFSFEFDECVRRVITSLENYFIHYDLKKQPEKGWLKNRISTYIIEEYYGAYKDRDLKIIRENILFIYKLRNLIVHDKIRLEINKSNIMLCKKAIGTLLYIYQSKFVRDDGKYDYIFSFHGEFKGIADIVLGLNLDLFKERDEQTSKIEILRTPDDINRSFFASLAIKDKEKNIAK